MSGYGSSDSTSQDSAEQCKIIYIPDKPPVPPHLQPTVTVIAAVIEAQNANTLVRKLNHTVPLENLRHVKRVRKKCHLGGKSELSVILCLASETADHLDGIPNDVIELIKQYQLSTFVAKVCKYAASTKEEWDEQCKLWPTSYHPPTYNIAGITGFNKEDTKSAFGFMKYAVDLARSSNNLVVNAAVIVDPSTNRVISRACDQVLSWATAECNTNVEINSSEYPKGPPNYPSTFEIKLSPKLPCYGSLDPERFCISCLQPWQWAEQQLHSSSVSWHPLRHAAMVAIECSASRDRLLFPNNGQSATGIVAEDCMLCPSTELPAKRQKTNLSNAEDDENLDLTTSSCDSARPYLCTGYDIYLVWEPCIMCAMALVHQRIRRIFYALPNKNAGALGSVHRLQGERSLNHHYAVFRVLLPEEALSD